MTVGRAGDPYRTAEPRRVMIIALPVARVVGGTGRRPALDPVSFRLVVTGTRQCMVQEDAGTRQLKEAEPERSFLSLV